MEWYFCCLDAAVRLYDSAAMLVLQNTEVNYFAPAHICRPFLSDEAISGWVRVAVPRSSFRLKR